MTNFSSSLLRGRAIAYVTPNSEYFLVSDEAAPLADVSVEHVMKWTTPFSNQEVNDLQRTASSVLQDVH